MKKIKVGLLILSNSWGGAEESTLNLAKYLDKNNFEVNLLVNNFLYERYRDIGRVNVVNLGRLESNKPLQKIFTILMIQLKLLKAVKKTQIEVIHGHLENSILTLGTMLKKPSIPFIFTLRGDETKIYHSPRTFEHKLIRMFLNNLFRRKDTTITSISKWLIKDFEDRYKANVVVAPNGVDCEIFRPLGMKKLKNTALYVGRFVKEKGIEDLLKVASQLRKYEFSFAGTGPLGRLINLNNISNLGFKKRKQIVKLYNTHTICVFPSHSEGFGLAALEAMACGCAVVVSNLGFKDYVESGKDGIIIEPGNKKQLKEAIVGLIENKKLRKTIEKNARKKALKYDIRNTIKNYEDLYLKIVKK